MLEENNETVPATEEVTPTPETQPTEKKPEYKPDYEKIAAKHGHIPFEQWVAQGRDPDEYTTAEDFVRNYSWKREIDGLKRTVADRDKALEGLTNHYKKVEEMAMKRAKEELNKRLEEAASIGDKEQVKSINRELVDIEVQEAKASAPAPQQYQVPEVVRDFTQRNASWFNDNTAMNSAMKAFALRRDNQIAIENPGIDPQVALRMVEEDVKKQFPQSFGGTVPKTTTPAAAPHVEAPVPHTPPKKETTLKDLPADSQRLAELLKRTTKNFNEKDFIRDCKIIYGL